MTTERFCVRNVRYDDLSVICALEEQCFAVAWTMDDFELFCGEALCEASDVSRSLFLVCTDSDGGICGYLCARRVLDEGEVLNVAASPSCRRMGVGRLLMTSAADMLASDGVREIFLEVRESNSAARSLYASLGYEAVGVRRCYYRCPIEDAVLMRCLV
nr:ribosomal protein S18-alanine N-acetyltransferase [Clostridia bacterium]